jgi:hypothetical protein
MNQADKTEKDLQSEETRLKIENEKKIVIISSKESFFDGISSIPCWQKFLWINLIIGFGILSPVLVFTHENIHFMQFDNKIVNVFANMFYSMIVMAIIGVGASFGTFLGYLLFRIICRTQTPQIYLSELPQPVLPQSKTQIFYPNMINYQYTPIPINGSFHY